MSDPLGAPHASSAPTMGVAWRLSPAELVGRGEAAAGSWREHTTAIYLAVRHLGLPIARVVERWSEKLWPAVRVCCNSMV
jgi:hypothetical protein